MKLFQCKIISLLILYYACSTRSESDGYCACDSPIQITTPSGELDCQIYCQCDISKLPSNLPQASAQCLYITTTFISPNSQTWGFSNLIPVPAQNPTSTKAQEITLVMDEFFNGDLGQGAFDNFDSNKILHPSLLNIAGNNVKTISPGTFRGMNRLRSLSLHQNHITKIEATVFDDLSLLEILDLSQNDICFIDDYAFKSLTELEYLWLSNNQLANVKATHFYKLTNLLILTLDQNEITNIDVGAFQELNQLGYLDLSQNQITRLQSGTFQGLYQLEQLEISSNQLQTIEDGVFTSSDLPQLLGLALIGNDLTCLESDTFDGLTNLGMLDVSENQISCELQPGVFQDMDSLHILNLAGNLLTEIRDNTGTWSEMTQLTVLDLSQNFIQVLDSRIFSNMNQLKLVRLGNNPMKIETSETNGNALVSDKTLVVDVTKIQVSNPDDLNDMGLPAPVFLGVGSLDMECSQIIQLTDGVMEDSTQSIVHVQTLCHCSEKAFRIWGHCSETFPLVLWIVLAILVTAAFMVSLLRLHYVKERLRPYIYRAI